MRNATENDMVRHECAEALGSIATEDISKELAKYLVSFFTILTRGPFHKL